MKIKNKYYQHFSRSYFLAFSLLIYCSSFGQLGFCSGSKGDPIFHEDFGTGTGSGAALPADITTYNYVTGDPNDGQYTISSFVGQNNTTWHNYFPTTTISNGKALIVNADFTAGQFYKIEISGLCENASYEFSAFLMNVYDASENACPNGGIPINVRFEIWNASDTVLLQEGSTGDIASTSSPIWEQYALTFQSQAGQDTVILKMFNNSEGGCGNDLAIDDIVFSSCGDFTTISSNGTGDSIEICEEELPQNISLEANPDFSIYNDHHYQWQQSPNGTSWTDIAGANEATFNTPITGTTYYRVQVAEDPVNLADNLCSTFSEIFSAEIIETPPAPTSNGNIFNCGEDNSPILSVTAPSEYEINWYDVATGGTALLEDSDTFTPETSGDYFAEAVLSGYDCAAGPRTQVSYHLYDSPNLSENETIEICSESEAILNAEITGVEYLWSTNETTQNITVSEAGEYHVTVTNNDGCTDSKTFEVSFTPVAEIASVNSSGTTITIYPANTGNFEYSLNGINFHPSNTFNVEEGGIYTAHIRDLNNCNVDTQTFPHIIYPKFFTPNNDGHNDLFEIKGLEYFQNSEIRIFDRYGKLLTYGSGPIFTWDGRLNNKNLPSSEYWFTVEIEGGMTYTGHFSLIR